MKLLTESFPSPEKIKEDIIRDGYHIYENAISQNIIEEIRNFWLDFFSKINQILKLCVGISG